MTRREIDRYLGRYGVKPIRPLIASSLAGVEQAVVIPALAERRSIFKTLAGLARNPSRDHLRTLVVCVVNNRGPHLAPDPQIRDNQETLRCLQSLVSGGRDLPRDAEDGEDLERIAASTLRLGYIDASSPGCEIPDHEGGVGTARKIGMDAVLGIMEARGRGGGVICCLDADTLVQENYLSAVDAHFQRYGHPAATVAYAHQMPSDPCLKAAICHYEIFLRAYVLGLAYAGSPYAHHAVGSTMCCTADGYGAVRGMNRRNAAEDFHFLDKLAKVGKIGLINGTTVFPSPRTSQRVPFGTGRRMLGFMTGQEEECRLYHPQTFRILRQWLAVMEADPARDADEILGHAGGIHPCLEEYLRQSAFGRAWRSIRKHGRDADQLRRQFHVWFDGLKTLRLIRHLGRSAFPPVPMAAGLSVLLEWMGVPIPGWKCREAAPEAVDPFEALEFVRALSCSGAGSG